MNLITKFFSAAGPAQAAFHGRYFLCHRLKTFQKSKSMQLFSYCQSLLLQPRPDIFRISMIFTPSWLTTPPLPHVFLSSRQPLLSLNMPMSLFKDVRQHIKLFRALRSFPYCHLQFFNATLLRDWGEPESTTFHHLLIALGTTLYSTSLTISYSHIIGLLLYYSPFSDLTNSNIT